MTIFTFPSPFTEINRFKMPLYKTSYHIRTLMKIKAQKKEELYHHSQNVGTRRIQRKIHFERVQCSINFDQFINATEKTRDPKSGSLVIKFRQEDIKNSIREREILRK